MLFQMVDSGDTAWVVAGNCLVLIMTPGLALFYGGLLRKKNVLSMYALCFGSMIIGSIVWMFIGFLWLSELIYLELLVIRFNILDCLE